MPSASASPSVAAPSTGVTRAPVSRARSTIRSVSRWSAVDAVRQRGLVLGVEAAVVTDRASIADERVVDEVGDARLVERADDLGEAERRGAGAGACSRTLPISLLLELGVGRTNPLGDDVLEGREVEPHQHARIAQRRRAQRGRQRRRRASRCAARRR